MAYKIRDWEKYFEQDRSKQWKHLKWVPIPNKQGAGYRKIMAQKNGLELFACWIALVQAGSLCDPRGDLSKYDINDLSRLTLISVKKLQISLSFLSQQLDWIEIIPNLDTNVKKLQETVSVPAIGSSILCSSVLSNTSNSLNQTDLGKQIPPTIEMVTNFIREKKYPIDPIKWFSHYESNGWVVGQSKARMKNWKAAVRTWLPEGWKPPQEQKKEERPPEGYIDAQDKAALKKMVAGIGIKI